MNNILKIVVLDQNMSNLFQKMSMNTWYYNNSFNKMGNINTSAQGHLELKSSQLIILRLILIAHVEICIQKN